MHQLLLALGEGPGVTETTFKECDKVLFEGGSFLAVSAVYRLPKGKERVEVLFTLHGRESFVTTNINKLSGSTCHSEISKMRSMLTHSNLEYYYQFEVRGQCCIKFIA